MDVGSNIMEWTVHFLNDTVTEEFELLPIDMQAKFFRIVQLIQKHGIQSVKAPHVKPLDSPLWEMRMKWYIKGYLYLCRK